MTPAEKINQILDAEGYGDRNGNHRFAELMETDSQTVRNWRKRGIPAKESWKAAHFLKCNPQWLVFDDRDLPPGVNQRVLDQSIFANLTDSQRLMIYALAVEFAKQN